MRVWLHENGCGFLFMSPFSALYVLASTDRGVEWLSYKPSCWNKTGGSPRDPRVNITTKPASSADINDEQAALAIAIALNSPHAGPIASTSSISSGHQNTVFL